MRNNLFASKRPNSLLRTWLGERKLSKPSEKVTKSLFKHKSKKISDK
jgi:hypothetical protein